MTACANHPEATALARCLRCRTPFCDDCITFLVNDDPWCEPCGNAMMEMGKGRPVLALVVLAAMLGGFAVLILVQIYVIERFYFYSAALGIVPFVAAWRIAFPPGARPDVVDRNATKPRPRVPVARRLA